MSTALSLLVAAVFTLGDLENAKGNISDVTVEGDVVEVFRDDIDADYGYLFLMDGNVILPVICKLNGDERLDGLIDSRIRATGYYSLVPGGRRIFSDPYLYIERRIDITTVKPIAEVFAVPELDATRSGDNPKGLALLGRRRATGRVNAVWGGNQVLLTTANNALVRLSLRHGMRVPAIGARITAVGRVASDLFYYVLDLATYRTEPADTTPAAVPTAISIRQLYINSRRSPGAPAFESVYNGQLVCVRGHVRSMPAREAGLHRLILEEDGFEAAVDVSVLPDAARDICVGCIAEVTGVYVIDSPLWNPTRTSPRVNGFVIAPRTADDIALVRRPPWWTPQKLAVVIGILLALLLLALVWSSSLRILVERRGRQLAHRQAETNKARLKTAERTRLAAELHDSVVPNLTGAMFEVRAAQVALPEGAGDSEEHLDIVLKTLSSSQTELRNCIWDLRNHALEQMDVDEAIRITLQPHLGDTALQLRFNVPRQTIPDSDLHNILCIIRELVINAIRHGGATLVKIAGATEQGRILFSVRDNGRGFDVARKPGMEQGHFGIEGITERAKALGGTLRLESTPGKGTSASVNIAVSPDN